MQTSHKTNHKYVSVNIKNKVTIIFRNIYAKFSYCCMTECSSVEVYRTENPWKCMDDISQIYKMHNALLSK